MIALEQPYVSDVLLHFLEQTQMPVLKNEFAENCIAQHPSLHLIDDASFLKQYEAMTEPRLYTVSEYALDRVCTIMKGKNLVEQVSLLKDKYAFRKACENLYDGFVFKEIKYADLFSFDLSSIELPIVLKPY